MKVFDNANVNGLCSHTVYDAMHALGVPRHIMQFSVYARASSKAALVRDLGEKGYTSSASEWRVGMGNDLDAMKTAGVFDRHFAVATGLSGGTRIVIDAISGEKVGDLVNTGFGKTDFEWVNPPAPIGIGTRLRRRRDGAEGTIVEHGGGSHDWFDVNVNGRTVTVSASGIREKYEVIHDAQ